MPHLIEWSPAQSALLSQPVFGNRVFVYGPAGSGKTTAACHRLIEMLKNGIPGDSILLFVPQRTLAAPYQAAILEEFAKNSGAFHEYSPIQIMTLGGLARRMVEVFWPLVAEQAGFARPDLSPVFLTLETTLFFMAQVNHKILEDGAFSSIHLERNRLYSQIIDNLNKAAIVGFPYEEISQRLKRSWSGEPSQLRIFDDVQVCSERFRSYCLENNLLDFSLQVELFTKYLWTGSPCHNYLTQTYRHLIVDNIEEDTPVSHGILSSWIKSAESALVLFDTDAGYRRFLGADPDTAQELKSVCNTVVNMGENIINSDEIAALEFQLRKAAKGESLTHQKSKSTGLRSSIVFSPTNYFPEMLEWTVEEIAKLIDSGTPKGEIAVLSPYLSDSLRYSLAQRLDTRGISTRTHRPSRALRDEPVTACILTLAIIAHPAWTKLYPEIVAQPSDVAYALMQAIEGLDLIRSQLLVENVYRNGMLEPFSNVPADAQERITYLLGARFENLREWIQVYREQSEQTPLELDHFLSKLFGELLSQPGYGFNSFTQPQSATGLPLSITAGEITANLIESIQKFRRVANSSSLGTQGSMPTGLLYILMVKNGVLAAQYVRSWVEQAEDSVLLAPAYTFLLENRPVDFQFWLDIGSRAWAERLYQPLTHPFVLSRAWTENKVWSDLDEIAVNRQILQDLTTGLLRRCRKQVFLGINNLGEQGYEQRGPLLQLFQLVLYSESAQ